MMTAGETEGGGGHGGDVEKLLACKQGILVHYNIIVKCKTCKTSVCLTSLMGTKFEENIQDVSKYSYTVLDPSWMFNKYIVKYIWLRSTPVARV